MEPPLADGRLKTARKGVGHFTLEVEGRAAHAGVEPQNGVSAIVELAHQVLAIGRIADPASGTTANVGVVSGGTTANVVPAGASAIIDARATTLDEARRFEDAISSLRPALRGSKLRVRGGFSRPPMERTPQSADLYARARAIGRRSSAQARSEVWPSVQSTARAVDRLYEDVTIDVAGEKTPVARVERQDLDELVGNLIENAAKYGGGRVFVTVCPVVGAFVEILVEDDGRGIHESERTTIFDRGARLDTDKPGTGLGLAIVRDVAEIYGGTVTLEESEDLGGLLARLRLPAA